MNTYTKNLTSDCNSFANDFGNGTVIAIHLKSDGTIKINTIPAGYSASSTMAEFDEVVDQVGEYARVGTHASHAPR